VFLARNPALWPLAALPALLAIAFLLAGLVLGLLLGPWVEQQVLPPADRMAPLLLALLGSGVRLGTVVALLATGFGLALVLTAPVLEQVSRRVEAKIRGEAADRGRGLSSEVREASFASLYFLAAAPIVFLLGLIPFVGPPLAVLWAAHALAFQLTDPPLARRGHSFKAKRAWHAAHRAQSQGFGLAGLAALLVPLANLLLGPAMAAGATLLVLDAEARESRLTLGGGGPNLSS
jgi:uncharacterized protein involved in cysteine biosynthesis